MNYAIGKGLLTTAGLTILSLVSIYILWTVAVRAFDEQSNARICTTATDEFIEKNRDAMKLDCRGLR